jgi:hypothetical protein
MRPTKILPLLAVAGLIACQDQSTAPDAEPSPALDVATTTTIGGAEVDFSLLPSTQPGLKRVPLASGGGVIRVYKGDEGWGTRENASLIHLGLVLGTDWFIHPIAALGAGVPAGTDVVILPPNVFNAAAVAAQNSAAAQAAMTAFLATGGSLVVDLADNRTRTGDGYTAPGSVGHPNSGVRSFNDCRNGDLTAVSIGPDGLLGTADDHPWVKGPDGVEGTGDDMDNTRVDMGTSCWLAHGNLADGFTLPTDADVLVTQNFQGVDKPVMAEYCHNGGRVIVTTFTSDFFGNNPVGGGWSYKLVNTYAYAASTASSCVIPVDLDIKPGSDPNSINTKSKGVIPVAILGSATFDVADVDVMTLVFGPNAASPAHEAGGHIEDVNADGFDDLVSHYPTQDVGLVPGDIEACVDGATLGGTPIHGCDAVNIVK